MMTLTEYWLCYAMLEKEFNIIQTFDIIQVGVY